MALIARDYLYNTGWELRHRTGYSGYQGVHGGRHNDLRERVLPGDKAAALMFASTSERQRCAAERSATFSPAGSTRHITTTSTSTTTGRPVRSTPPSRLTPRSCRPPATT